MNPIARFFKLLDNYPSLAGFWDRKTQTMNADLHAGHLSGGERIVLHSLASIWFGSGHGHEIDITDLATVSTEARQPIIDWLINPFWP